MPRCNVLLPIEMVCETTGGSGRVQVRAVLLQLGLPCLQTPSADVQEVIPEETASFLTHEKTTKSPHMGSSVTSICLCFLQMLVSYFTELWI